MELKLSLRQNRAGILAPLILGEHLEYPSPTYPVLICP